MYVYEKVKLYIQENHLKQTSIARKAGIKINTFNAMLNGKRKMYVDDLIAICYALNVSSETFIQKKGA